MSKKYSEYYPNQIATDNKFEKHLKNIKRFSEFCRGKSVPYYQDEGNWGTKLDPGNISEKEGVKRAYLLQEFYIWKEWKEKGRNIFHFSENITELLKQTDVLDIDISLINLPYSGFYIDLSCAKIPFEEGGLEIIEGAFIRDEHDGEGYERAINIDFVCKEYIEKYWNINKDLCWDSERGFHSILLFLDRKDNLKTVEDAINFDKRGFVSTPMFDDRDEDTKKRLYSIHKQFVDRTINFIINCLLYLTTKEVDIDEKYPIDLPFHLKSKLDKATTKRKKEIVHSEILHNGFTKISYIGYRLRSSNTLFNLEKEVAPHWRRGHWRNQKFGENLNDSKLIWIMPTIVNKERGEPQKGHIYKI
ncbi:hypothetical protein CMT57_06000 [Elizabethkingia anophelis]|uniref:hypothetical protein n=1 Tax=Elizabethkingia anophelis TaxID=1117645 RepID=UPI0020119E30|nr:hypothetical protein [Elizabethkingia anophelis]MCL1689482.1 hypothetical protein [Elizabethkingia anophelis]MDV4009388.1 hypothetical protein [Elizabethkingia anophelis]